MTDYGTPEELIEKLNRLDKNKQYKLTIKEIRNIQFHKKYWAFVSIIALSEGVSKEEVDTALKINSGHRDQGVTKGRMSEKIKQFVSSTREKMESIKDSPLKIPLNTALFTIEFLCASVPYYTPKSISFEKMSEDEFREYYNTAVNTAFTLYEFDSKLEDHLIKF